jgi:hypothetical protein
VSERSVHLVGGYPADDARQAMVAAIEACGKRLRTLPDGEVGERRDWTRRIVESFWNHPDVEPAKDGARSGSDSRPVFKVKRDHQLTAASLDLGHAAAAKDGYAIFRDVQNRHELDRLSFQVGIPGDLDLALFVFGPLRAFAQRAAFQEALVQEITEIAGWGGRDVLFQLELSAELIMVATAPGPLRKPTATFMADNVVKLVAATPPGTRFGVHLCPGHLNHRAPKPLKSAAPLVALTQALVRAWPEGRGLEYVHLPLAAGDQPPAVDPAFHRDLQGLTSMPRDLRFVIGLAHEDKDLAEQVQLLNAVEDRLNRPVDVAPACGLGGRTPQAAWEVLQRAAALAES